ncbi:hypothetical protein NE237_014347 [Protea cynaroides]|uniref:Bifunctional inhibitor/plant lipid transfer protein/seed storage helical domain-containing protein n=1 Tax=Protea cynaroides TaxID=273540 RepID=A0A9Q0KBW7_9MAGN|nr:hypothetical protein NE237_014347 [Protea cynaroides]
MGAMKGMEMKLVTVTVMMLCVAGAVAQSSCTNVIIGMAPCLNYVTGSSSNPSSSCCKQLVSVVQSQPQCLCQVLNGGGATAALGITINQTQALQLPGACNVKTRPVSACNGGNGSSTSPATESPVGSPTGSISAVETPVASPTSSIPKQSTSPVTKSPVGSPTGVIPAVETPVASPTSSIPKQSTSPATKSPVGSLTGSIPAVETPVASSTSSIPKQSFDECTDSTTPLESDTPGEYGSKKEPWTSEEKSEGNRITKSPLHLVVLLLLIASFATTFTSF